MLLAAGSGRRFGSPKALVDTGSGPWVLTTLEVMTGCDELVVVIGAQASEVRALLPTVTGNGVAVRIATNAGHLTGMGSSLAIGLAQVALSPVEAALVMLVDLPDVRKPVLDRLAGLARRSDSPMEQLLRASYDGHPGHPVLIGRNHFAGVIAAAGGDSGARDYLARHEVTLIECGDIGGGRDIDTPSQI